MANNEKYRQLLIELDDVEDSILKGDWSLIEKRNILMIKIKSLEVNDKKKKYKT